MSREEYPNLQDRTASWLNKVKPKLDMVSGWARHGLSDEQIALNLGIGVSTFYDYKKKYPELGEALRDGREDAQIHVENALFKKAVGYKYKEVTKERQKVFDLDGKWTGEYAMVTTKTVMKHVQPDTGAIMYWLEHRAPDRWPKNPVAGMDPDKINTQITSIAQLMLNPVPERQIGSEMDD